MFDLLMLALDLYLPFKFNEMTILSKVRKPDNFVSHNFLKLSFTNIQGLSLNFIRCQSFLQSNFPDILSLRGTNLDNSIYCDSFPVRGYLSSIQKDSVIHMDSLALYLKEAFPFQGVLKKIMICRVKFYIPHEL